MFCQGVLYTSFTDLSIPYFVALIVIAVAAIHLFLFSFNCDSERRRKRCRAAASIVIAVVAIHLLLCCYNCNCGRERTRFRGYDVFLSFRGRDVRKGFVDHLYHALDGAGFHVFLDTYNLQRGEDISISLQHGIEMSRILIPIFSTNYAESAWCLREVSLIAHQVQGGRGGPSPSLCFTMSLRLKFGTQINLMVAHLLKHSRSMRAAGNTAHKKLMNGGLLSSHCPISLGGHSKKTPMGMKKR